MSDQVKKDLPICAVLIDMRDDELWQDTTCHFETMDEAIKYCEDYFSNLNNHAQRREYGKWEIYNRVAQVGSEIVTTVTHFSYAQNIVAEPEQLWDPKLEEAATIAAADPALGTLHANSIDFADNKGPEGQTSPLAPLPNNLLSAQDLTPTSAAAPASDAVNASTDAGDEYETISVKSPGNHPTFWNLQAGVHYADLHTRLANNAGVSFWPSHYPAEGIFEKEDINRKPDGAHDGFALYFKVKKVSVGNEEQQTGTKSENGSASDASQSGIGGGGSPGPDYTQKAAAPAWCYFSW